MASVVTGLAIAKSGLTLLARVVGAGGSYVTQASLSGTIDYTVYNKTTAAQVGTGSFSISNVVFDALVLDLLWDKDGTGYNLRCTIPASLMTGSRGDRLRVDLKLNPASGESFFVPFEFTLTEVYGS